MVIEANKKGTCPHCKIPNRFENATNHNDQVLHFWNVTNGLDNHNKILSLCRCTNCGEVIIFFGETMVHPIGSTRPPCPKEVPTNISNDYKEACLVEHLSSKATATLARRCLQDIFHQRKIIKDDLSKEIDEAMKTLPSHLSEAIDSIRNVGNFGAHPIKSTNTGLIVDVEDGEAEWNLDVIEQLFDFYYVQPAITQSKKDALNLKLKETGKPEMK
ncbi:MAG: DUF4145 domain-containing protein [Nanoarchaeota archaeon]|nr:DUF4145 domain-containing protein [Nanoarchaeota archaeon]